MSDGIAKRLSVTATVAQSENVLYALIVGRRRGGGRLECGRILGLHRHTGHI